jgi:hypothetical protein
MDPMVFALQLAALVAVAAPAIAVIALIAREVTTELPMPLLFDEPEPPRGIADGDLDPWRLDLLRPRSGSSAQKAADGHTPKAVASSRGCELAPAR